MINGMSGCDFKHFTDCLIKANDRQLKMMLLCLEAEIEKREEFMEKNFSFEVFR